MIRQHTFGLGIFIGCFGLVLGLIAGSVQAVEVQGLYDVEIPVSNQSRELRQEAFKRALERVMVRISGNTAIAENENAQKISVLASRYVRQFQYRALTEDDEFLLEQYSSEDPEAKAPSRVLAIQFDGAAIEGQLRKMNITTWSANRPSVLMWVAVEQRGQRQLLSESEPTQIRQLLEQSAKNRGIPLIFPQMDLEDQGNIEFGDIRGNFSPAIRKASQRYEPGIVVAGLVTRDRRGEWSAEWTVYRDNVSSGWSIRDKLSSVLSSAIDGVSNILISRYGETSAQRSTRYELILQVDQVGRTEDYARSLKYLSSLSVVESVQPHYITNNTIQYKLLIRGEPRYLERAISLGKTLIPRGDSIINAANNTHMQADLYYRLYR